MSNTFPTTLWRLQEIRNQQFKCGNARFSLLFLRDVCWEGIRLYFATFLLNISLDSSYVFSSRNVYRWQIYSKKKYSIDQRGSIIKTFYPHQLMITVTIRKLR